jgi:tight adherence protein C
MNNVALLTVLAGFEAVAIGVPVMLLRQMNRKQRLADRIDTALITARPAKELPQREAPGTYITRMVGGLGGVLMKTNVISPATLLKLETTLASAGFRTEAGLQLFIGSKILMLGLGPLLAWFALHDVGMPFGVRCLTVFGGLVVGILLPDFIIGRLHARNARALERGLPDALDLMVICAEAGMGLEHAMSRVAIELMPIQPKVSYEFQLVGNEIRLLSDRRVALKNMGVRTGLASFKRLGATLLQALQYGTPLAASLRVLAAELREEAHIRFEGRAARLPVLLTLPMIIFILPCLFLIVGGPAGMQIARALHP